MSKVIITIFMFLLIFVNSFCQKNKINIVGIWQSQTEVVGSGHLDNYQFYKNGSFKFNTNDYNGLNRIVSIGGKFSLTKDTIIFIVEYTLEYVGGYPIRSRTTTLSDSWELINGRIIKNIFEKAIEEKAQIQFDIDKNKNLAAYLLIDGRIFYKTDNSLSE